MSEFPCLLILVFSPHPTISWSVDFYAGCFPLSFTELFFLGPWKRQVQHLKNNFPFKLFYIIIKASVIELRSISSISLLHRYCSVLSPFVGRTAWCVHISLKQHMGILQSVFLYLQVSWLCTRLVEKMTRSYFPKRLLFCFLLLVFANNLLILFWFFVFLAVLRSVGEFYVSESSVERVFVLWVVFFFFYFLWQRSGVF